MNDDPVSLCLAGHIAPNVALARMILDGVSREAIAARLSGHKEAGIRAMLALLNRRWDALGELAKAARSVDHAATGADALDRLREGFDRAALLAPEMSVAAYTLGDPELIHAATKELVAWLAARGLLDPAFDVLDLGCGIGRVASALAPHVRSILGIDVSPQMIAEARRRHPGLRFEVTAGRTLRQGAGESKFDLVLAVDTFPYLIQAGVADQHVADAAKLLRPGGGLAIFNLSYRGITQDRANLRRWASSFGFVVTCDGEQPFKFWDGRCFLLLKPAD